ITGDCFNTILAWALTCHRIFIIEQCGLMNRYEMATTVDTRTWKVIKDEGWPTTQYSVFPPTLIQQNTPFLLANPLFPDSDDSLDGVINKLDVKSGKVDEIDKGYDLLVTDDQTIATYIRPAAHTQDNRNHLIRLTLATMKAEDMGSIGII